MAAQVVDPSLKATRWVSEKPKEYTGKSLEDALKALEKVDLSKIPLPAAPIAVPSVSSKAIGDCISQMKSDIKTLESSLGVLKKGEAAANSVISAAAKTKAELQKVINDKKTSEDQKKKYQAAAQVAAGIESKATTLLAKIK